MATSFFDEDDDPVVSTELFEATAPRLGVIHVPKCGGMALRGALAELPRCYTGPLYFDEGQFGSAALLDAIPAPNSETIATTSDLAVIRHSNRLVMGHFAARSLISAGWLDLAVQLREPRSRMLSLYRYWQDQPGSVRMSWGRWGTEIVARADDRLNDFLAWDPAWPAVENVYVRQLMADPVASRRFVVPWKTSSSYAELRRCLRVAEWDTRSQAFLERICEIVGETDPPLLEKTNVTQTTGEVQKIDAETLRLLDHLTRDDRELLDELARDGTLARRSASELDEDFEMTAVRLGFEICG